MTDRTLRGKVAVVGIAETEYYKWGRSPDPEFKLAIEAVLKACADAGIDPRDVDGFSSYSNDRSDASRLSAALGCHQLSFASMQWGGGGGGGSGAVANGAAAIATGQAECVVVFRALAQGQFGRFGQGPRMKTVSGAAAHTLPFGLMSAAQMFAMKVNRFMHDHGVQQEALRAISLASYEHAQHNPRAVMHGRPLDAEAYDELALDRRAVPPLRLLPGERRGRRHGAGLRRAGRRLPAPAVLRPRRRVRLAAPLRRAGAQHARVRVVELHHRGAPAVRHGHASGRATSTCCRATRTSPAA